MLLDTAHIRVQMDYFTRDTEDMRSWVIPTVGTAKRKVDTEGWASWLWVADVKRFISKYM
jgi:hypothetical protein